jgi:hypothetical protein
MQKAHGRRLHRSDNAFSIYLFYYKPYHALFQSGCLVAIMVADAVTESDRLTGKIIY